MSLHHFLHEIRIVATEAFRADIKNVLTSVLGLVVSLALLVVGLLRWVEYLDFGFSKMRRSILITMHLVGCLVFAASLALLSIDVNRKFSSLCAGLLASGLCLLFPIQIYIGVLRRVRARKKAPEPRS